VNKSSRPSTLTENPPGLSGDSICRNVGLYLLRKAFNFQGDWVAQAGFFVWAAEDVQRKKILATGEKIKVAILKS